MSVNSRTPRRERRTQAERRAHTRQALLDAALLRMDAGDSFDALSLRSVTRAAGVVPAAFYRHFASMDELGLELIAESSRTLRALLREARAQRSPEHIIRRSVEILVEHVREHRQHYAFVARVRSSSNGVLRHAIRNEVRLFTSELATDLGRFPVLQRWSTEDLQMLAGLLVGIMITTIEEMLDQPATSAQAEAEIMRAAERRLRFTILAVPNWRSDG